MSASTVAKRWWKVNGRQGRAPKREEEQCRVVVRCSCGRLVELVNDNDLRACACGNLFRIALAVWMMDSQTRHGVAMVADGEDA